MDDGHGKLNIISDHFQVPTSSKESLENGTPSTSEPRTDICFRYCFIAEKKNNKNSNFLVFY